MGVPSWAKPRGRDRFVFENLLQEKLDDGSLAQALGITGGGSGGDPGDGGDGGGGTATFLGTTKGGQDGLSTMHTTVPNGVQAGDIATIAIAIFGETSIQTPSGLSLVTDVTIQDTSVLAIFQTVVDADYIAGRDLNFGGQYPCYVTTFTRGYEVVNGVSGLGLTPDTLQANSNDGREYICAAVSACSDGTSPTNPMLDVVDSSFNSGSGLLIAVGHVAGADYTTSDWVYSNIVNAGYNAHAEVDLDTLITA